MLAERLCEADVGEHTRRSEEVRTRVSTNSEVTSPSRILACLEYVFLEYNLRMHTHEFGESWVTTLHVVPEGLHVRAVEQLHNHLIVGPLPGSPGRDVTLQTARVVPKSHVGVCKVDDRVGRRAERVGEDRTKVDRPILEWARRYTTSTSSLGDLDQRSIIGGDTVEGLVAASSVTVTAHRGGRAIQSRALHRVVSPSGPVVVWLIALVTALVTEGLLISVGEVTMPWEEVASVVDGKCLLDMCCHKVVYRCGDAKSEYVSHAFHTVITYRICSCSPGTQTWVS